MPARRNLAILGFGGHARSVADIALAAGFERLIFIDAAAREGEAFAGFPALAAPPQDLGADWVWVSAIGDNARRAAAPSLLAHLDLAQVISPRAHLGVDAVLGAGCVVGHFAHIGPAARVGEGCIINTGAIVEHECEIGAYAHISVNATVAGRSRVGARTMIGAGAVVIDGVRVGDDAMIGAGCVVVCDLPDPGIYVGAPARRVR